MRRNVETISTRSVASGEIEAQQSELAAAMRKLARMNQRMVLIRGKIAGLRQELADARSRQRRRDTPETRQAVKVATNRLAAANQRRERIASDYRDLKPIVREQRALYRKLEKKEEAKQKAVAKFLREWERNYDREIRIKEKNVRQRKRLSDT
jgi:hypothetical protein